jgi:hypothetical protein
MSLQKLQKGNGEKILAFELLISTAGKEGRNNYYSRLIGIWVATGQFIHAAVGPVAQSCNKPTHTFAFFVI